MKRFSELSFLRLLRVQFLFCAALMMTLMVAQGTVGWHVANRSDILMSDADDAVNTSMGDLDLLRNIKRMQINTLVIQSVVGVAAADDPVAAKIEVKRLAKEYEAAHGKLKQMIAARNMTALGGITDLEKRVNVALDSFRELRDISLTVISQAAKNDGEVPAPRKLEISARVDGLYEQLDRMAEGVDLLAAKDKQDLVETLASTGSEMKGSRIIMLLSASVGLLAAIGIILFVLMRVLSPLSSVAKATRILAEGNIQQKIPRFGSTEITAITAALAVFRENLLETERLRQEQDAAEQRSRQEKHRMVQQLADSFETSVQSIVHEVTNASERLHGTAGEFSLAAQEATSKAREVAVASERAASNVHTVSAAAEQLSASIKEIARQVETSNDISSRAVRQADDTNTVVSSLKEAVAGIDTVVRLINERGCPR